MTEVPAVVVRCGAKGCGRVIGTIGPVGPQQHLPSVGHEAWGDPARGVWISACPKHGGDNDGGSLAGVDAHRARMGLPAEDRNRVMRFIAWRDLRRAFDESLRSGRAAKFP